MFFWPLQKLSEVRQPQKKLPREKQKACHRIEPRYEQLLSCLSLVDPKKSLNIAAPCLPYETMAFLAQSKDVVPQLRQELVDANVQQEERGFLALSTHLER